MVNFTMEQVRQLMSQPNRIRNFSIIAHVDHGKSTLTDALLAKAGVISRKSAGEERYTDGRQDEKDRGITIKSTGVTLYYELEKKGPFLVNLIDSPGHVDFSSEVTAALRVTDGALVVVDCIDGVCVQTETVLRQAIQEKIKPVLIINKVDRAILEKKLDGEQIYQLFVKVIDQVNQIIQTYQSEDRSMLVSVEDGSVAFGCGKDQWAFTVPQFAQRFANVLKTDPSKLKLALWGEHYYNPETKTIVTNSQNETGEKLQRSFVKFMLDPIIKLSNNIIENNVETTNKILDSLQVHLTQDERKLNGKPLLKCCLSKWINAAEALLDMITDHLPSPAEAQQYRTDYLYQGPLDDPVAIAMRECDPKGPLIIFISKMIPTQEKGRFFAFGRVFSGTVGTGQPVRVLGQNYKPGSKEDLHIVNIQRTAVMMGRYVENLSDVPCGNTVGLLGIDKYIQKTATITDFPDCHTIRPLKFSVSPVVRVAVKVKDPQDLPKLVEGLQRLSQSDQLVQISTEESGSFIVAGCGELHIEICLNDLQKEYAQVPLVISDPVVSYKETVTERSYQECLAKTTNKLNRLYGHAIPLGEELTAAIEKGRITSKGDAKQRAKLLVEEFDWNKNDALAIWSFGPDFEGPNLLADLTSGVQYVNDIKDSMQSAWQGYTREGSLAGEGLRGVRMNLTDCMIHTDPVHRGGGQILPAARRLYSACQLSARPRLQEPVFLAEISCPMEVMSGVYQCLNSRRGIVVEQEQIVGTPIMITKAFLPVSDSFGFNAHLRSLTQGQAFPQCVFDHWETINGDPLESGSKTEELVIKIRQRKGLKAIIPGIEEYLDKL